MRFRTQIDVTTAKPGRHSDTHKSGLYLIVSADKQNRRWAFRYTKPTTGRPTEIGLGSANVLTLAEARDMAHEHRRTVAKGTDPVEQQRGEKRAQTTFAEVVKKYLTVKRSGWRTERYPVRIERLLTRYAKALGCMAITKITPDDVERALQSLWQRYPLQGRRALGMISQVFDFAIAKDLCDVNPADWRRMKHRFPRTRSGAHFAAMPYEQVPGFVQQLHAAQETGKSLIPYVIEFLLLTACRTNEVVFMQWDEIDFDTKVWTVAASRTKSEREHRVPLCDRAMELLHRQHQCRTNKYVWCNRRKRNGCIAEKSLYLYLTRRLGQTVTIHGFRSSFRDFAGNETSFDRVTCELCLAHRAGDATELAYRRSDALAKRRALMELWADYCQGAPTSGNVVEFRSKVSAFG